MKHVNTLCIKWNDFFFLQLVYYTTKAGYSYKCQPVVYSDDDNEMHVSTSILLVEPTNHAIQMTLSFMCVSDYYLMPSEKLSAISSCRKQDTFQ